MAVRILVPEPGIELMSPALEAQSLNYWITIFIVSGVCMFGTSSPHPKLCYSKLSDEALLMPSPT